jgi:hypothetical protein
MSFAGKKNIYTCDRCFGHVVTVDLVEGTTPFTIVCRATKGCSGAMRSSMYRVFDQTMRPDFEWYRPGDAELDGLRPATADHVRMGGLLLRNASTGEPA